MKKPNITPGDWHQVKQQDSGDIYILNKQALATGAASVCQVPRIRAEFGANAQAIAALPKLLEALEQAHNALLYIAQEAEARAGVPKPIIGGARHHAAQAKAALLAAGYTE